MGGMEGTSRSWPVSSMSSDRRSQTTVLSKRRFANLRKKEREPRKKERETRKKKRRAKKEEETKRKEGCEEQEKRHH